MEMRVDPKGERPPSEQIAEQIRCAVASGELKPGARLQSVRALAVEVLVNPNTVARAYRELEWEGTLETRPGDGFFVSESAPRRCRADLRRQLALRIGRALDAALSAGFTREEIGQLVERRLGAKRREVRT